MDTTWTVTGDDKLTGRPFVTWAQAESPASAGRMVEAMPLIKNSLRVTRVVEGGPDPRDR